MKGVWEMAASNPKVNTCIATALAWINVHWIDWGQPLIQALTSIASFLLVVVMLYKHYIGTKLDKKKLEEMERKEDK